MLARLGGPACVARTLHLSSKAWTPPPPCRPPPRRPRPAASPSSTGGPGVAPESDVRLATPADAEAVAAIYAPVVRETAISFELEPPTADQMRTRIADTLATLPWLVSLDADGHVDGYAYAGRHRERAAYQWSVDVTAYVRADRRRRGVGGRLHAVLLGQLAQLGYCQAFAGIALPNEASVRLHESLGFAALGVYRRVGFKLGAWRDVGWWQKELQPPPAAPRAPLPLGHPSIESR